MKKNYKKTLLISTALFFALSLSSQAMNPGVDEELTPAIATTLMKNYVAALPNKARTLMEWECGEQGKKEPYHQIHYKANSYNKNKNCRFYAGDYIFRFIIVTFGSAAGINSLYPESLFGSSGTWIMALSSVCSAVGEWIVKRSQEQTKEAYFSRKLFI